MPWPRAARLKAGFGFYLLNMVVRSLTLGSARVYAYTCMFFFGLPKLQTDRQQDPQMQTHRHADRDTQTECGKTRKEGRVGQRNREREKKVRVRGEMEAVGGG